MHSSRPEMADPEHTQERWAVLRQLEAWLQTPMLILGFVWLALVIVELVWGEIHVLGVFGTAIWVVFIAEFLLRFTLAPDKGVFLRGNWITLIALVLPAFRILRAFRVVRLARAARGLWLVRLVGTANRGMNALRASMGRRGLGYVLVLTVLVALLGAAGMLAFEPRSEVEGGFAGYGDALWWTAMLLTTMGSQFWPVTGEGRLLCFLLSVYGFAVFGYVTASLASFFIGQEAKDQDSAVVGPTDLAALTREIALLRAALQRNAD